MLNDDDRYVVVRLSRADFEKLTVESEVVS